MKIYMLMILLAIFSCSKIIKPEYKVIEAHNGVIEKFYLIKNESKLVTSSFDGKVKIWDLKTLKLDGVVAELPDLIFSSAISPNEKYLLLATKATIYIYDLDSWEELLAFPNRFHATTMAINNSYSWMVVDTGEHYNFITIINLKNNTVKNTIKVNVLPVGHLSFVDDNTILTGAADSKVFYYDIVKDKILKNFEVKNGIRIQDLKISSDQKSAFLTGQLSFDQKDVVQISLSTGKILKKFSGIQDNIPTSAASISHDGKYLAVTGREVIVYDIQKEKEFFKFYVPGLATKWILFTKDGHLISNGSSGDEARNDLIYIWELNPFL